MGVLDVIGSVYRNGATTGITQNITKQASKPES